MSRLTRVTSGCSAPSSLAGTPVPPADVVRGRGRLGTFWVEQIALVAAAAVVYFGVRALTVGSPGESSRNAYRLIDFENQLGLDIERWVQGLVVPHPPLVTLANWVYIWLHWPVIVAVLTWLLWKHPTRFGRYRNALLITGVLGMVIVAVFPVMPPRLMELGLVDTISEGSRSYRALQPPQFVNQYAAMPSFHVGWDLLMAIALVREAQHRWLRIVGWLLPPAMLLSVTATANHYLIDGIAGDALVLGVLLLLSRAKTSAPKARSDGSMGGRAEADVHERCCIAGGRVHA